MVIIAVAVVENTGVNGLIKKVMKAYVNYDAAALTALESERFLEAWGEDEIEGYHKTYLLYNVSSFRDPHTGDSLSYDDVTLSFRRDWKNKLSDDVTKRDLTRLEPSLSEEELKAYCGSTLLVCCRVTVKRKDGKDKFSYPVTFYLVKEEGQWRLFDFD